MNTASYGDSDPIVAHATAIAESALAIIRTSGQGSVELVSRCFSPAKTLVRSPGNTLVHGWIVDAAGNRIDEVMASVFRSPRSYTGEDGVDITCHGGIATVRAIMEVLIQAGFRSALPGEFTFRSFMNGKIDLTRAESVMELVEAKTDTARSHAVTRLSGALEQEIRQVRDLLVSALSATELFLDYSEDDGVSHIASEESLSTGTPKLDPEAAGILPDRESVEQARGRLEQLGRSYRLERLYQEGATVVIAGRPNAGKSRLFNRIVKEERSIVTDVPGTTRDWIEAWISVQGIPIRLIDTAGLREAEDPVERIGVERSRSVLREADAILYVIDGERGIGEEDRAFLAGSGYAGAGYAGAGTTDGPPVVPVWNKADRRPAEENLLPVSAATGAGVAEAMDRIASLLEGPGVSEAPTGLGKAGEKEPLGIASERQKRLIDQALQGVHEALDMADRGLPLDLIAPTLREAVDSLGEITGEVSTADILERMFSRFCVGK